jgi:hypothetical protein
MDNNDEFPLREHAALAEDTEQQVLRMNGPEQCRSYFLETNNGRLTGEVWIPAAFKHMGIHWYSGMLLDYMMRPNEYVQQYLDDSYAAMGYPNHPNTAGDADVDVAVDSLVVALHLRRGDKARETGIAPPLTDFLEQANVWARQFKQLKYVYIATDDPSVVVEARTLLQTAAGPYPYTLLKQSISVAELGHQRQTAQTQMAASLGVIADILTLANADFFIGTCTSGVSRTASSISIARKLGRIQQGMLLPLEIPVHMDPDVRCKGDGWNPVARHGLWTEPTFEDWNPQGMLSRRP